MVAECGVLLTHVTQVVEKQGIRRVGLDAGMNALMRPTLYDAYHGIHNLARIEEETDAGFDVVGPICESGDVFGAGRMLPAAAGDGKSTSPNSSTQCANRMPSSACRQKTKHN